MPIVSGQGFLRIGELSQRVGVSPELLRAWERRYGLLRPSRSSGGFRLYSAADEARIRRMQTFLDQGVAAAQAAQLAAEDENAADDAAADASGEIEALEKTLEHFDDAGGNRVLDRLFARYSLETVISDVLLPYLSGLGERWATGEVTVAQEHFASNIVRGRLMSLARGWDEGFGPRALLACPEGELHDIALIAFGLALNRRGWRITFLGAHTPGDTLVTAAERLSPDAIVIAISDKNVLAKAMPELRPLARVFRVALGGRGATVEVARAIGADVFSQDPIVAAGELSKPR